MSLQVHTRGDGPDLVLLHGWSMHAGVWEETAALLARRFRVHAVDLPGHGASPLMGSFTLETVVETLLGVLPPALAWAGWSLGGMLALAAAARAPERVGRLVLVGANPRFVADGGWPGMEAKVLDGFAAALAQAPDETLARFDALVARGDAAQGLRRRLRDLRRPVDRHALEAGLDVLARADLRPVLPGIGLPVLLVQGDGDALVPPAAARQAASLLPDARLVEWADAGHAPFLSRPADFAACVEDFLA